MATPVVYKHLNEENVHQLLQLLSTEFGKKVTAVEGLGLSANDFTDELKSKLEKIEDEANKYVHPTHDAQALAFYKVQVDEKGHVVSVEAVTKQDIVDLGIPAQDTTYVVATQEADGLMSKEDKKTLDNLVSTGGQANVIEKIIVNGNEVDVEDDKSVYIEVPTGALANSDTVSENYLAEALKTKINGKANQSTVDTNTSAIEKLNGGETTVGSVAHTVKQYVDTRVASAYKAAGSVLFDSLPELDASYEGYVYNIINDFTTIDGLFIEGGGHNYVGGTNVVVVDAGDGTYKFDVLAMSFNGFVQEANIKEFTDAEITTIWNSVFTA